MDMLLTLTSVTIFTLMLTIGVGESFEQLSSLWRQSRDLLHALFAALVLVPIVVIVLLLVFDLPPAVVHLRHAQPLGVTGTGVATSSCARRSIWWVTWPSARR